MSLKPKNEPSNPLFQNSKIMKFKDILTYSNCIFVHVKLPERLNKFFTTAPSQHCYNITGSRKNTIIKPSTNSVT